jgi:hypothetical protein
VNEEILTSLLSVCCTPNFFLKKVVAGVDAKEKLLSFCIM